MKSYIVTTVLVLLVILGVAGLAADWESLRLPGNDQGYEPDQPIAFSHRLHAGEMQIDCLYCHTAAETSRHAGFPPADTCMNCHQYVRAPMGAVREEQEQAEAEGREPRRIVSPEIRKIYEALGLDDELKPDPDRSAKPLEWIKIHNLPDYVYFNHAAHVNAGVQCQECHGPVETMERVRQVEDLSMGWCVNCHRDTAAGGINGRIVQPSTDCGACHY